LSCENINHLEYINHNLLAKYYLDKCLYTILKEKGPQDEENLVNLFFCYTKKSLSHYIHQLPVYFLNKFNLVYENKLFDIRNREIIKSEIIDLANI
jgi:hypothetical protein